MGADLNARYPSWEGDTADLRGRTLAEYLLENLDFMVCPKPGIPLYFEFEHRAVQMLRGRRLPGL